MQDGLPLTPGRHTYSPLADSYASAQGSSGFGAASNVQGPDRCQAHARCWQGTRLGAMPAVIQRSWCHLFLAGILCSCVLELFVAGNWLGGKVNVVVVEDGLHKQTSCCAQLAAALLGAKAKQHQHTGACYGGSNLGL